MTPPGENMPQKALGAADLTTRRRREGRHGRRHGDCSHPWESHSPGPRKSSTKDLPDMAVPRSPRPRLGRGQGASICDSRQCQEVSSLVRAMVNMLDWTSRIHGCGAVARVYAEYPGKVARKTKNWFATSAPASYGSPTETPSVVIKSLSACEPSV